MSSSPEVPTPGQGSLDLLSANLFKVVTIVLALVGVLLIAGLAIETWSYYGGIHAATTIPLGSTANQVDHAAIITYARGLGAAFIKTSALFLGFILIFTGTLYVLRTAEASFDLQVSQGGTQGSLHTASPGLVIVTLGVALTMVAIMVKSDLGYQKTTEAPTATAAQLPADTPDPSTASPISGARIHTPAPSGGKDQ
jgi:hypothetical protein